jgi:hypothetical protein
MYNVRMKRITASEARRNWFQLLDRVLDGEVVAIVRKGERIVIRKEPGPERQREAPDYRGIIQVIDAAEADRWSWDWAGGDLVAELRD